MQRERENEADGDGAQSRSRGTGNSPGRRMTPKPNGGKGGPQQKAGAKPGYGQQRNKPGYANATLTLTPGHHVPVGPACCSTLKLAKDVKIGDTVWKVVKGLFPKAVPTTVTAKTVPVVGSVTSSPSPPPPPPITVNVRHPSGRNRRDLLATS